jgi:hypothetical protein
MKLGFVGGCLNKQPGLAREQSYYYLLRERLKHDFPQEDISISLGYYTSYDQLAKSTDKFINAKSPDILFLFLRPFPLMALHKLYIKYDAGHGKMARRCHPSLFNRRNINWPPTLTNYTIDDVIIEPRREKFGLRDLNLLGGLAVGLDNWVVNYLAHEIESIRDLCVSQNKKIALISLPQNPESLLGNYICRLTNTKLKARFQDIPFIEIYFMGETYFEPDGIHYNPAGHKLLAETLFHHYGVLRSNLTLK